MTSSDASSSAARRRRERSRAKAPGPPPGPGAWFDREAADRVCNFFSLFLTHHSSGDAGKPFVLTAWQRDRIIRPLFGWKRADGLRWYRRCDLWIPRKNGKSKLAAGIALYLAFADGEAGAEVYMVANDKQQAQVVFNHAVTMVQACPELREMSQIFNRTSAIVVPETLSGLRALSSEPSNKDGLNISGVVFDEIHELKDTRLWEKMTTGSGARRQPLILVISTAGYDRHTVGYREYVQDKRILAGESRITDRLVVVYEARPKDNWRSERTWKKVNPALGTFLHIGEMRSLLAEAREDASKEGTFKRYYLNIWTSQKTGWIDIEKWDACGEPVDLFHVVTLPCWIGLDLSKRSDITAAVALFREDKDGDRTYHVLPHFFVPDEEIELKEARDGVPYREWARAGHVTMTPGNCIEYAAVRDFILERWARKFQVREVAYDPYNATHLADELQKAGLTLVEFPQTIKHVSPPTMELKNLVLQGKVRHGGNPILRWMVGNVAVLTDVNANERLTKKGSTARIDGVSALVNALGRASVADTAPSVYEQRGVIAL